MRRVPDGLRGLWPWYWVFCSLQAALHLVAAWHLWGVIQEPVTVMGSLPPMDPETFDQAAATIALGAKLIFATVVFFGVAMLFVPRMRFDRNAYWVHLTNLVLGTLGCVLTVIALPLLLKWMRPETKAAFAERG